LKFYDTHFLNAPMHAILSLCLAIALLSFQVALHYLNNGSATLRFAIRKQEFLVPVLVVLRALSDCTDMEIYQRLLQGEHDNMFLAARYVFTVCYDASVIFHL